MTTSLDLVLLTAGADEREAIRALITERTASLGIGPVRVDYRVHPRRDPGCFNEAPATLDVYQGRAIHALVVFDREGSGQEDRSSESLEADLRERLRQAGWADRAQVVVIDPELEVWVWAGSEHVAQAVRWPGGMVALRAWLITQDLWDIGSPKPARPKAAFERALRHTRTPRAPALYGELGGRVGLRRCQDPAFHRLVDILRAWFPLEGGPGSP